MPVILTRCWTESRGLRNPGLHLQLTQDTKRDHALTEELVALSVLRTAPLILRATRAPGPWRPSPVWTPNVSDDTLGIFQSGRRFADGHRIQRLDSNGVWRRDLAGHSGDGCSERKRCGELSA